MIKNWLIALGLMSCVIVYADSSRPISDISLPSCDAQPFQLEEATISSIQTAIRCHKVTCEQVVHAYIDRIKYYNISADQRAPFNAIARINVNALEEARALDVIFDQGYWSGALHCVPILLKDNIDTYDAISSSGSLSMLGNQPSYDAFLVEQLRKAGAIILGKGVMDEFASGVVGISSLNGRVGNAYNTENNPGGSSGGVAVAVSANFVLAGIGTDNSGSIRIPSAFNGLIGLRPTMKLMSQRGIFPRGNLDATTGPIARTVEDLARIFDVIAEPDPLDINTQHIRRPDSYLRFLDSQALQGKRIGIVSQLDKLMINEKMPAFTRQKLNEAIDKMKRLGAVIVPNINLPDFNLDRQYSQAGEREDVNAYLASYPAVRQDYYDICESGRALVFGSSYDCMQFVRTLPKKFGKEYYVMLNIYSKNSLYLKKIMEAEHVDALLIPVSIAGDAVYDSKDLITELIASNSGLPAITFPIAYTEKTHLPIGIELIGKKFSEPTLIAMAYAYEHDSSVRVPPTMPTINETFVTWDINRYNQFLVSIGYNAYQSILLNCSFSKPEDCLTATAFQKVVIHTPTS